MMWKENTPIAITVFILKKRHISNHNETSSTFDKNNNTAR